MNHGEFEDEYIWYTATNPEGVEYRELKPSVHSKLAIGILFSHSLYSWLGEDFGTILRLRCPETGRWSEETFGSVKEAMDRAKEHIKLYVCAALMTLATA